MSLSMNWLLSISPKLEIVIEIEQIFIEVSLVFNIDLPFNTKLIYKSKTSPSDSIL